jgi:hypothetical protein
VISGYVSEVIGVSPIQCSGVAARVAGLRCPLLALGGLVTLVDPEPWHTVQIAGTQVCALPSQVHPGAGTRPPPLHAGQ